DYQNYKADMLKQADTAYDNTNAEYLGNQSGNFNSAAQQIASSAKNDLINKADLAAPEFEDRYNTEQRQKQNDTLNMVNTLLGIETRNQNAEDKAKSDYAATANQYYDDFQAEINKIKGDNDPTNDWKAGILGSLRQEKIQTQKANQAALDKAAAEAAAKGNQQAFENALKVWQTDGIASDSVAKILNVPKGASTKDYDVAKINATIAQGNLELNKQKTLNDTAKTQYQINKPYYNPNSGSGGSGKIDQNSVNFNDIQSSISAYGKSLLASPSFKTTTFDITSGKNITTQKYGMNSVPYVSGIGERIKEYVDGGLLTKDQANQLSTQALGKSWDNTVKVVKYNQAVNALSSGEYANNPKSAYENILNNKDKYTSAMGTAYYNSLLNKYWQASKKQVSKTKKK
ncbi:MAG: hypothetical protein Q8876_09130, partial [Bacillota bacterium]|nr:hypothetical protein [Bacillota bacterium]